MDYKINTKCILSGYSPKNGEPRQLPIYQRGSSCSHSAYTEN